jgi:hypothetical protein
MAFTGHSDTCLRPCQTRSHFGKALLCSPDILNGVFLSDELEVFIKQAVAVVTNRDVVGKDDDLSRGTARQLRSSLGRTQKLRGPLCWTAFVFVHKTSAVSHHPVFNPCWDDPSSFVIQLLSYISQTKVLKYNGLSLVRAYNPIEDLFEGQLKTHLKG